MTHDRDRIDEILNRLGWIELSLRVQRRQGARIMEQLDGLALQVGKQAIALREINTQTSRIGDQVANVAADIADLVSRLGSMEVPQALMDQVNAITAGLNTAAATLTTVADSLEATAAEWPPAAPPA